MLLIASRRAAQRVELDDTSARDLPWHVIPCEFPGRVSLQLSVSWLANPHGSGDSAICCHDALIYCSYEQRTRRRHYRGSNLMMTSMNGETYSTEPDWYTEPHLLTDKPSDVLHAVRANAERTYHFAGGHKTADRMRRVMRLIDEELQSRLS